MFVIAGATVLVIVGVSGMPDISTDGNELKSRGIDETARKVMVSPTRAKPEAELLDVRLTNENSGIE